MRRPADRRSGQDPTLGCSTCRTRTPLPPGPTATACSLSPSTIPASCSSPGSADRTAAAVRSPRRLRSLGGILGTGGGNGSMLSTRDRRHALDQRHRDHGAGLCAPAVIAGRYSSAVGTIISTLSACRPRRSRPRYCRRPAPSRSAGPRPSRQPAEHRTSALQNCLVALPGAYRV